MSAARRHWISFALGLCAGVALFGLLDAMIGVRRPVARVVHLVRDVAYRRDAICDCGNPPPRPRTKPMLYRPHPPPALPPIEIEVRPWTGFSDAETSTLDGDAALSRALGADVFF